MSCEKEIALAEEYLGITFNDKDLLKKALTHGSFAYEAGEGQKDIYERLEFLGDAVLNFVITDFIFLRFPKFREGDLARLRANLVNAQVLADLAQEIRLGECVFLGRGAELSGGRERTSILSDSYEAVLGAIYLDQGIERVKTFILQKFRDLILKSVSAERLSDDKTALQEYAVSKFGVMPDYEIVLEEGPVHDRVFSAEVSISRKVWGRGSGGSKKKAELAAAKEALEALAASEGKTGKSK